MDGNNPQTNATGQPISPTVNQPISQPINQATNQTVGQVVNSAGTPVPAPVEQAPNAPTYTDQTINQPIDQSTAQSNMPNNISNNMSNNLPPDTQNVEQPILQPNNQTANQSNNLPNINMQPADNSTPAQSTSTNNNIAKVLLVEDDNSLREIYSVRLSAEGYNVISSGDGEEALTMAISEKPDLILSDVMMPKISGFEMLDLLKSNSATRNIPVIMLTALSSEQQRNRSDQLGATKYLIKSQVGIEDIVHAVHQTFIEYPPESGAQLPPTAKAAVLEQAANQSAVNLNPVVNPSDLPDTPVDIPSINADTTTPDSGTDANIPAPAPTTSINTPPLQQSTIPSANTNAPVPTENLSTNNSVTPPSTNPAASDLTAQTSAELNSLADQLSGMGQPGTMPSANDSAITPPADLAANSTAPTVSENNPSDLLFASSQPTDLSQFTKPTPIEPPKPAQTTPAQSTPAPKPLPKPAANVPHFDEPAPVIDLSASSIDPLEQMRKEDSAADNPEGANDTAPADADNNTAVSDHGVVSPPPASSSASPVLDIDQLLAQAPAPNTNTNNIFPNS